MAFRRGGTLHWVGSDHLGGTIRVLDSSFTALDGMRYKPYGEDRDAGDALVTDRKFTGQTEDEAAGLYWYASRAYDPAIGRFVSPDPIVPAPANPQSLNRYSYVATTRSSSLIRQARHASKRVGTVIGPMNMRVTTVRDQVSRIGRPVSSAF